MADTYSAPVTPDEERARRRWPRRLLIASVVILLVLVGLLVAADRVAAGVAERTVAERVRQQIADRGVHSSPPEVTVGGFPFLTQVASGRFESISVMLREVRGPVGGDPVRLGELVIEARDVTASLDALRSGRGDVVAETVEGVGTIPYDSVGKLMDRPGVQLAEQDGDLVVTSPLEILGQQFTVTGVAELTVEDGVVQIRFDELTAEGLPPGTEAQRLLNWYARQMSISIALPDLPFQLEVKQVQARPDGLAVTASAQNVVLSAVA